MSRRPTWEAVQAVGLHLIDEWAALDEPPECPTISGDPVWPPLQTQPIGPTRTRWGWVEGVRRLAPGRSRSAWTRDYPPDRRGRWVTGSHGQPAPLVTLAWVGRAEHLTYPRGRRVAPKETCP